MNEEQLLLLTVVLQVVSIPLALRLCLPDLLLCLGWMRVRNGIDGGPSDLQLLQNQTLPQDLVDELASLGFSPAGIYWESISIGRTFWEYVYARPEGVVFATVYRLFLAEQPRVAFLSVFTDGAAIITQNYPGGATAERPDFHGGGVEANCLAEVLEEHLRRLQRFCDVGRTPLPSVTIEDFLEAQRVYHHHPYIREVMTGNGLMLFLTNAMLLFTIPAVIAWCGGYGLMHPFTWGALLVASVLLTWSNLYGNRVMRHVAASRSSRQEPRAVS